MTNHNSPKPQGDGIILTLDHNCWILPTPLLFWCYLKIRIWPNLQQISSTCSFTRCEFAYVIGKSVIQCLLKNTLLLYLYNSCFDQIHDNWEINIHLECVMLNVVKYVITWNNSFFVYEKAKINKTCIWHAYLKSLSDHST